VWQRMRHTVFVSSDILGTNSGHYPRHSRKYADFISLEAELQTKRVDAFLAFAKDVQDGTYPQPMHEIRMAETEYERFLELAKT